MVSLTFITFFIFISAAVVLYLGMNYLFVAGNKYEQRFTQTAQTNLSEIFIFIDPKKLFALNIAAIFASFCIFYITTGMAMLAVIAAVFIGMMPRYIWALLKSRRNNRFLVELPDALTSISSMMKAGTNLSVALEVVVAESKGPIAQEFGLFLKELRVGVDYDIALDNLMARMPLPELELVVAGMKISREIGGSLADILHRLADTLRRKLEMDGKIKALTAQGKAQGWVMSCLPILLAFVLYHMEPEAMQHLFTNPIGWVVCVVFVIMLYLGYFFIKKIVTIDV
jgi:tight adherence protein B